MGGHLRFVKMQGAGNDYVYLDGIRDPIPVETAAALAARLADRHFGIGGDGLILLAPSAVADLRMLMWNADGSRGAMCGNGLRCLARLGHDHGHVRGPLVRVETDSGVFDVTLLFGPEGRVTGARVPMPGARVAREAEPVEIGGRTWSYHRGSVGNPHAVVFVDGPLEAVPVAEVGAAFQRLAAFPDGVNVEFVRAEPPRILHQRTFERGSGETLACGSGATVAALCALQLGRLSGPAVEVRLRGGSLTIRRREDGGVEMEGPAVRVFEGRIELGA
jgi:diaminopimelate epimerase